ncbi:MGDG synthase family glycosyltransferase [Actinomadura miaoliensis]|uniref:MGDG synthase family glycosyltransferase n=1 Tax=Actinomadura miaoliensis TaxID=430685 RepID=UPI0031EB9AF3
MTPARHSVLIVSASMGAGHDGVAAELARRLTAAGGAAEVVDLLDLLPLGLGGGLRRWYGWMMRSAPWVYALIYRVFFVPPPLREPDGGGPAPRARRERRALAWDSPLTVLAAARLRRLVGCRRPGEVVTTFHVAAQAAGRLRGRGRLAVPSTVLLTDFAVHRMWLHPGNDRYLCPSPSTARRVTALTGRPAACCAPLTGPAFHRPPGRPAAVPRARERLGVRPDDRLVLVSAGSWGVGEVAETARVLAGSGRYLPVVLCGRNERLRRRLAAVRPGLALGWRDDLPALMADAYALVDNAAGLTCREAFAAGLPVISYRPIPGHGRDGALAMARDGLSVHADGPRDLLAALDRLAGPGERARLVAAGAALFAEPSAEALLLGGASAPAPGGPQSQTSPPPAWSRSGRVWARWMLP